MKNNLLAIGWDVGGWMGSNHGFSILHWNYENKLKINGYDLVIGIDAPLSFPKEFKNFINNSKKIFKRPESELPNLVGPEIIDEDLEDEGWIYYFPKVTE